MSDAEFEAFAASVESYDAVAFGNGRHRVYTVAREAAPEHYVNHGCEPNAAHDGSGLVATRDVGAGDEITVDYAPISRAQWSMACNCRAPRCRGVVRGLRD